jgi:hypothetical protein
MNKNDGGPAFPDVRRLTLLSNYTIDAPTKEVIYTNASGMTLRDYFAAKAMASLIDRSNELAMNQKEWRPALAAASYAIADAMLAERDK